MNIRNNIPQHMNNWHWHFKEMYDVFNPTSS